MVAEHPGRWFARLRAQAGSVRARTTLAAVGIVGVALVGGAVLLVVLMRTTLTNDVLATAREDAADLAANLQEELSPEGLLSADPGELRQVLDESRRVIGWTANVSGRPPVADLGPGEWAQIDVPTLAAPFLAVAATTPDGERTVLVAVTLEAVVESTDLVARMLAAGLPIVLLVIGGTTWVIVGRALAPVESMRSEVEAISAAELHRRVPEPSGTDEIARLATTMNNMLDRLEHAQARQRQFVSDTSHELRSPIASIRQHVEVAIAHPEQTTAADLAETVLAEEVRLQRLVDDLLLLARADERTLGVKRRSVDLDDLVFEQASRLRQGTTLLVDTASVSAGRVTGDEAGLRRALSNLADNAARHARSRLAFSLVEHDRVVELHVDDDGPGIAPADRLRVFDRFVRLDAARARDDGGSGLGLAIVAELVAAHGGTVAITDSPLGGVRVHVQLPRGAEESD